MKTPKIILTALLSASLVSGCAMAPRKRILMGVSIGGAGGAVGGAVFSPNSESRGLNTLVFGLVGAVVGGLVGLLIHDDSEIPEPKTPAQNAVRLDLKTQEFSVSPPAQDLPAFVRERLKPVVVEELQESDTISEDGSLHEPHKVYRIKHQAELIAKPFSNSTTGAAK